ncbi:aminopeptidase [Sinimarinibacterium thermocellulolyticum]|uniref:Aminopeptidase n=1 Tax=Sinimarinibacterium thermocellulolyticum TaxID=3170016 RepID=A0ABV2AA46_9GAMM
MRLAKIAFIVLASVSGVSCTRLGYYAHLAGGQIALLSARQPIARLIEDPATDAALRERLCTVREARAWAAAHLHLPANGSYTAYADLQREYVAWNVFATPEFSLAPLEHCFPFAGCVAYQGFYALDKAEARARELRAQGYDVHIGGVPAYSTLGWFDDPLLSTMMRWDDATLIGTLFHELAHQKLYVRDDSAFNESYASFIEQQGLREYLAQHPDVAPPDAVARGRRTQFVQLILAARQRLEDLYALPLSAEAMRARKAEEFARLKAQYLRLRDTAWDGDPRYDGFFADDAPNNARLLPFGLYDEYVPAFALVFEQADRDWARFHDEVGRLTKLDADARRTALAALSRRRLPE